MHIAVNAVGTRPLLMHNVQLASPLNKFAKQLKAISSKKTKTEEDRLEIAHIEFLGGLYLDQHLGPFIPGTMVFANLIEGARFIKSGKKVERGLDVVELVNPLIYDGPRTAEELWADPNFVDIRSVRVSTSRVDRTRPIFQEWEVNFDLLIDPDVLSFEDMKAIIDYAGRMSGFGDYRKMYGRYRADVKKISD